MAATRCTCGAPAPLAGTACHYCGGSAAAAVQPLDKPVEPATGPAGFVDRREAHEREAREREAREREAREREARVREAREREIQGREAREREARQRAAREGEVREREAREREAREREARAREARAREARQREAREVEARERQARGREASEREARESEAREREAREREARRVEQAVGGPVDVAEPYREDDQEADDRWDRLQEGQDDGAPAGPPPAREARRFRGLAVPLVAAAVVAGIGYPLTALAVSRVRLPETPGQEQSSAEGGGVGPRGRSPRVRLSGAVTYDGPARPIECAGGTPILVTYGAGEDQVAIRLGLPSLVEPGSYEVKGQDVFVAVTRLAGKGQTWSTRNQPDAAGRLQVHPDRSLSAQFSGLKPTGGAGEDTVQGSLEMRCG